MIIKKNLFVLVLAVLLTGCDKQDPAEREPLVFEENTVDISLNEQTINIKASRTHWYMRVKEVEESMNQQMDTIKGNWYTLMKKDKGEYLSISVASNEGEERKLFIGIMCDNVYSQIVVNQSGV